MGSLVYSMCIRVASLCDLNVYTLLIKKQIIIIGHWSLEKLKDLNSTFCLNKCERHIKNHRTILYKSPFAYARKKNDKNFIF